MNYWEKRALENRELTDAIEASSFVRLNSLLVKTLDKINRELEDFDIENINDYLTAKEIEELKALIKKAASYDKRDAIMHRLYNESAKLYKYNRLDGLKISLQARLSELTASQQTNINSTLVKVGSSSYKFAAETFSKKYAVDLSGISRATVQALANQTWVGTKNWSKRIWKDRQLLGNALDETLKDGISRGYPLQKIARDIKLKFQTSTYNAMRLVRTETTHVHEQATLKLYEDTGTEKYVYMATIDDRTSEICRKLNGHHFFVKDAQPGVNLPPMHPNCRSTTAPIPDIKRLYKKYGINEREDNIFPDSKVVDANGNLLTLFHGTMGGDFMEFNPEAKSNTFAVKGHFYFSSSPKVAKTYIKRNLIEENELLDPPDTLKYKIKYAKGKNTEVILDVDKFGKPLGTGIIGNKTKYGYFEYGDRKSIDEDFIKGFKAVEYLVGFDDSSTFGFTTYVKEEKSFNHFAKRNWTRENSYAKNAAIKEVYLDIKNPFVVDYKGKNYTDIIYIGDKKFGKKGFYAEDTISSLSEIERYAQENGYDGVIAKNVRDTGGLREISENEKIADDYIVFDKKQIKIIRSQKLG